MLNNTALKNQSSKALMFTKQVKRPNADREYILYFNKVFFLLHRTKEPVILPPKHVVEHSIVRTDLHDKDSIKV